MFKKRHTRGGELNVNDLLSAWSGEQENEYGVGTVIGTVAVTLYTMGRAKNRREVETLAQAMWERRNKERISIAA